MWRKHFLTTEDTEDTEVSEFQFRDNERQFDMTSSAWLPLFSEGGVSEGRGGRTNEVLSILL